MTYVKHDVPKPQRLFTFGCCSARTRAIKRIILALFVIITSNVIGGCAAYEYEELNTRYHSVEDGRGTIFTEVRVRDTSSAFKPWHVVLVEPCNAQHADTHLNPPPCWPAVPADRTEDLLQRLCEAMPQYRRESMLIHAAEYAKRDIATFEQVWIVSTNPIAIAIPETSTAHAREITEVERRQIAATQSATTGPTTIGSVRSPTTGLYVMTTKSVPVVMDFRKRYAKLPREADLDALTNSVMLFPANLNLDMAGAPENTNGPILYRLKLIRLREPQTLRAIMRAMTDADGLAHMAADTQEIPVR